MPSAERGSDYTQRIIEVITNLALLEDRYAGEVLSDILQQTSSEQPPISRGQDGTSNSVAGGVTENEPA